MLTIPQRGRKSRWAAIITGIMVFLWLAPEDNHVWPAVLLGTLTSTVIVLLWLLGKLGDKTVKRQQAAALGIVCGGITGFGASLATTLLMLLKNARHSHFFPDFPPEQMGAILKHAPIWTMAGGLVGLGFGLLLIGLNRSGQRRVYSTQDNHHSEGMS